MKANCALLIVVFGQSFPFSVTAAELVPRYAPHEVTLTAKTTPANPYIELTADCTLTAPDGKTIHTIPLFWDCGATWKLRFAPDTTGVWKWSVRSNDAGLDGQTGAFQCVASERRGGLQTMSSGPLHFQYQNGQRVWFMGDTAWALLTDDAEERHNRTSVEQYLKNRAAQGFNAVHSMLLNEAGWGNSGGSPWHDLATERINPAYWQEADARVAFANAQAVTVGLVLAWGEKTGKEKYPWGRFSSVEARKRYARYIAARYSAYDVYFLVSGEWNGEVRHRNSTEDVVRREFMQIGDALRAADPHGRMIGIHPMTKQGSTRQFNDAAWMSFADYQQNYTDLHGRILQSRVFNKPVVNSEYAYYLRANNRAGIVDKPHSATVTDIRNATWDIVMAGGYFVTGFGSTYMGGHRHPTSFLPDDPKNVPWEKQVGLVKQFFTALDWWRLAPHDELVSCDTPRGKDRSMKVDTGDAQRGVEQAPAVAYWALAEPGRQYVVYARGVTKPVSLRLDGNRAALTATRFDPRSGQWKELGTVAGTEHFDFQPPDAGDWLVVLR